jgi:hypothetical protein
MVEYVAGSCDLRQNEGHLISHSISMKCGHSPDHWSMEKTRAWEHDTFNMHFRHLVFIYSNWYTRILDRCVPLYALITFQTLDGIWYDISRTQHELYLVWRLVQLGILHKRFGCTTLQSHSLGGLWVEQQRWCFQLHCCLKNIFLLWIHPPARDQYWSDHPTILTANDDHCAGIQPTRKFTNSLN